MVIPYIINFYFIEICGIFLMGIIFAKLISIMRYKIYETVIFDSYLKIK